MARSRDPHGPSANHPPAHGGGPAAAPPAPAPEPLTATPLALDIDAEVAQLVKLARRTMLDRDLVRIRHGELRRALEGGAEGLEPDAPPELPVILAVFDATWTEFQAASKARLTATSGAQLYSLACRTAAAAALPEVRRFKKRVADRITGETPLEQDVQNRAGVHDTINEHSSPTDIANLGNKQLDLLDDEKAFELLTRSSCYPDRVKTRLAQVVQTLDQEIDAGVSGGLRAGAASTRVNLALLKLQVVLSRAYAFLDEFGDPDTAAALEKLLPRRYHRGGADGQTGTDGAGGGEGGGGAGGGGSPPAGESGGGNNSQPPASGAGAPPATNGAPESGSGAPNGSGDTSPKS